MNNLRRVYNIAVLIHLNNSLNKTVY